MLDGFDSQDLLGAFVYTFISPDLPSSVTPKHDLDTAAFSVVEVILENERGFGSKYRLEAQARVPRHRTPQSHGGRQPPLRIRRRGLERVYASRAE